MEKDGGGRERGEGGRRKRRLESKETHYCPKS